MRNLLVALSGPGAAFVLVALCLMMAAGSAHPLRAKAAANPVVVENQQPGSNAWRMTGPVSDDTPEQIKGYASATSVNQNESRRASRPGLGEMHGDSRSGGDGCKPVPHSSTNALRTAYRTA